MYYINMNLSLRVFLYTLCSTFIILFSMLYAEDSVILKLSKKDIAVLKEDNIWREGCPISLDRLRIIRFPLYDFQGYIHKGELIVMDVVAKHVLNVMNTLYTRKFPLDRHAMGGFMCRDVRSANGLFSLHAYGLALDINEKQNPYLLVDPKNARSIDKAKLSKEQLESEERKISVNSYFNRKNQRKGMLEPQANIFYENGFVDWGGDWIDPKDYQHFQIPRTMANILAIMSYEHGEYFFDIFVKSQSLRNNINELESKIVSYYTENPNSFMAFIERKENSFVKNTSKTLKGYN